MTYATLPDGTRDGLGVRVDGATCRSLARGSLRAALDADDFATKGDDRPFDIAQALAPLPRAAQFLDASAYVNHVDLVRRARGAAMPDSFWTDPLMYQGCADPFLPSTALITGDPAWGLDFEAELAIVTTDVPQGVNVDRAAACIRLVMLLNDISLRHLIAPELAKGFGFVQSKPPSACAPLAIPPADLPGWDGTRLHGPMQIDLNGQPFGRPDTGIDMTFDFARLIAHAARTRPLPAGTVIGSGTISNREHGNPGRPLAQGGAGYACIAEQRMVEMLRDGAPATPFLQPGDRVRIGMDGPGGSLFGDIIQHVA